MPCLRVRWRNNDKFFSQIKNNYTQMIYNFQILEPVSAFWFHRNSPRERWSWSIEIGVFYIHVTWVRPQSSFTNFFLFFIKFMHNLKFFYIFLNQEASRTFFSSWYGAKDSGPTIRNLLWRWGGSPPFGSGGDSHSVSSVCCLPL